MAAAKLHPEYLNTRFRPSGAIADWPGNFVIITACATTGEVWSEARTRDAQARLASAIEASGAWHTVLTGYSPATGHAEAGWAVALDEAVGVALGREFLQDAIYTVRRGALWVLSCGEGAEECFVDAFAHRLDQWG